jgi:hypothetical protein
MMTMNFFKLKRKELLPRMINLKIKNKPIKKRMLSMIVSAIKKKYFKLLRST